MTDEDFKKFLRKNTSECDIIELQGKQFKFVENYVPSNILKLLSFTKNGIVNHYNFYMYIKRLEKILVKTCICVLEDFKK